MNNHEKENHKKHRELPAKQPLPPQPFFEYPISDEVYYNYCAENLHYDPSGSYTGLPDTADGEPVQDADDL